MRCFVAVPLPAEVCAAVGHVQERVRKACEGTDIRWVAPESLHVTLKFLGKVEPDRVLAVRERLAAEVPRHTVARLSLAGVGAFPSARRARVVWLGVRDGVQDLALVAAAMDRALEALDFAAEDRSFSAHLTLGRVRAPRRGADLSEALATVGAAEAGAWSPPVLVLFESRLGPAGAVHRALAEYAFG